MADHDELWEEISRLRGLVNGLVRREANLQARVSGLQDRIEQLEDRRNAAQVAEEEPDPEPFFLARQ